MKRKLIALFVLLGSVGLAQAGCCGSSKKEVKAVKTEQGSCRTCNSCCGK
jgi:hypothetical protein